MLKEELLRGREVIIAVFQKLVLGLILFNIFLLMALAQKAEVSG